MAGIDLIPQQYVLRKRLQRRLKASAAALLSAVCIVVAARAGVWSATSHEQHELARLRRNEVDSAQTQARMRDYEQQKAAAEKQLRDLNALRGSERAERLLVALDGAYLTGVWFDEVTAYGSGNGSRAGASESTSAAGAPTTPASAPAPSQPAPAPSTDAVPTRWVQRVELVGHAIDHSRLAAFLTRLAAQPGLSDVRLLDTSSRAYSATRVTDFKVSLALSTKEERP